MDIKLRWVIRKNIHGDKERILQYRTYEMDDEGCEWGGGWQDVEIEKEE